MGQQYARVAPEFWTGDTGRQLRKIGRDAQVVALYLITGPTANPIGLYYLPIPTLCHETGLTEQEARKSLASLSDAAFAYYDDPSESVFVVEMARYQITDDMKLHDKRHKWIVGEAEKIRKSPHYSRWHERYKDAFSLHEASPLQAPTKPTPTSTPTSTPTTKIKPLREIIPLGVTLTDELLATAILEGYSEEAVKAWCETNHKRKPRGTAVLPDWVPVDAWGAFLELRVKLRKPLTERGKELAIVRLKRFRGAGSDPREVLEQSVERSWLGLFPVVKDKRNPSSATKSSERPFVY